MADTVIINITLTSSVSIAQSEYPAFKKIYFAAKAANATTMLYKFKIIPMHLADDAYNYMLNIWGNPGGGEVVGYYNSGVY